MFERTVWPPAQRWISSLQPWLSTINRFCWGQIRSSRELWGVERFDLMQIHNMLSWEGHLETLLEDKDASVRLRAMHALDGLLGPQSEAADLIAERLEDSDVEIRLLAAAYLGRMRARSAAARCTCSRARAARADAVINSGYYSLEDDWYANFEATNNTSEEIIFVSARRPEPGLSINFISDRFHYNQFSPAPNNGRAAEPPTSEALRFVVEDSVAKGELEPEAGEGLTGGSGARHVHVLRAGNGLGARSADGCAAGEDRDADDVHVLLERGGGDHLGRLPQAGVDHLHPGVPQRGAREQLALQHLPEPPLQQRRLGQRHPPDRRPRLRQRGQRRARHYADYPRRSQR